MTLKTPQPAIPSSSPPPPPRAAGGARKEARYKTLLLFGAPGSGKGTQGKIIGTIPGFFHVACGDIFRSLDLQSEMGRTFWQFSSTGRLVPDQLTVDLWKQYMIGMEYVNRFFPETEIAVLDGIPRNVEQARLLEDTLDVLKVIHLKCDDVDKMVERLRRRALRENRFDDANDDVIAKRMQTYDSETRPVLEFYPPERVTRIDATLSQIQVLNEIVKILVPLKETPDLSNR